MSVIEITVLLAGYIVLMATSGKVVNYILSRISTQPVSQTVSKEVRDTGFVVGKCENLLIITFMILDAYTALSLVVAAKALVRSEDMRKNSLFFLAGTMINVTYSIMAGFFIKLTLETV